MSLTFANDVAPHLKRGLKLREKRLQRTLGNQRRQRATTWWFTILGGVMFWIVVGYSACEALKG